jgi:glycosyltransferase involved in cell wall biosynthesis
MSDPTVSFIVPAYNAANSIQRCIQHIVTQDVAKEIIAVDNNSSDDTLQLLQSLGSGYKEVSVRQEESRGPAAARNNGLNVARGRYIAFIDSDAYIPPHWATEGIKILASDPSIAAVGGLVRSVSTNTISKLFDPLFLHRNGDDTEREIGSLATLNALFEREALEGERFDEGLITNEDPELCFRIRKRGYKFILTSRMTVQHHNPDTLYKGVVKRWFSYGRYYPVPFVRHPENIDAFFLGKVVYMPLLLASIAFAAYYPSASVIPAALLGLVFVSYASLGAIRLRSLKLMVLFPFMHTLKFLVHGAGVVYGFFDRSIAIKK